MFAICGLFVSYPVRVIKRAEQEHERSERLLRNVLPVPIAARLKDRPDVIGVRMVGQVTAAEGVADSAPRRYFDSVLMPVGVETTGWLRSVLSSQSPSSSRVMASWVDRLMLPESQPMPKNDVESLKPQWYPPVIVTKRAGAGLRSYMARVVAGLTIVSREPTT